jgi:hypothetical protein
MFTPAFNGSGLGVVAAFSTAVDTKRTAECSSNVHMKHFTCYYAKPFLAVHCF